MLTTRSEWLTNDPLEKKNNITLHSRHEKLSEYQSRGGGKLTETHQSRKEVFRRLIDIQKSSNPGIQVTDSDTDPPE